jgi:aspartate carbamoyltransferase catalytic subunit
MALRIQKERQNDPLIPSLREYSIYYGINRRRLARAKPDVLVMHPGPINRGVELSPDVADGPSSVILQQVNNGVAVRMALLYLVMGGEKSGEAQGDI